ncbi:MAG: TIGR00153 family protein [Xanthomonadales bacterium]|nr:TIGR00153 family protein [Xanthomonadales bacterium]
MKEVISMFGKSPVMAIQGHSDLCLKCAQQLKGLFKAAGRDERKAILNEIIAIEKAADDAKREIRKQLQRKLFMPVSRNSILELVLVQDKVANKARDIARIYCQRFEKIPDALEPLFTRFLDLNLAAVEQATRSVHELDELYETAFRGAEVELVSKMVEKLDELESESDDLQWEVGDVLRSVEDELSAVDVMFLYRIITSVSRLGDLADRTGRQLEVMLSE